MAAIYLAIKALLLTSKPSGYVQTTTTVWRARFSPAYDHPAQGTNAVAAEGRNVTSVLPETTGDTKRNARTYNLTAGFVVGDIVTTTQGMESAYYDFVTKSSQDVKDTIVAEADNNVVDTAKCTSIQDAAKQTETSDEID